VVSKSLNCAALWRCEECCWRFAVGTTLEPGGRIERAEMEYVRRGSGDQNKIQPVSKALFHVDTLLMVI
jgi:hypothetical protein